MQTITGTVLKGNTVSLRVFTYDDSGALVDPEEVEIQIVRGERIIEGRTVTSPTQIETGKYRYDFDTSNYEAGEYVAVWRAKVLDSEGNDFWLVAQEEFEVTGVEE